jgi:hypothetical protein
MDWVSDFDTGRQNLNTGIARASDGFLTKTGIMFSEVSHKKNSVAWDRERTILTKRQPFIGEVSANICG